MPLLAGRWAPHIEGDFVVLLIGAGVNSWWSLPHIFFVGSSMQRMIKELQVDITSYCSPVAQQLAKAYENHGLLQAI